VELFVNRLKNITDRVKAIDNSSAHETVRLDQMHWIIPAMRLAGHLGRLPEYV
jgi:hypothetical protein